MTMYTYRRSTRGWEYAYIEKPDPHSITYFDIVGHEDEDWSEWELVETTEEEE